MDEESESFSNSKSLAAGCCLAFAWFFCQFQPGVAYKSVSYKKSCSHKIRIICPNVFLLFGACFPSPNNRVLINLTLSRKVHFIVSIAHVSLYLCVQLYVALCTLSIFLDPGHALILAKCVSTFWKVLY